MSWMLGVFGNGRRSSLDLSLLLRGDVSGRRVDRKVVRQELGIVLADRSGKGAIGLEVVEGDAESLLTTSGKRLGQLNAIVLDVAVPEITCQLTFLKKDRRFDLVGIP